MGNTLLTAIIGEDRSASREEMRRYYKSIRKSCKFVPKDYELIMYLKKRIEEDPHDPVVFSKDYNNIRDAKAELFIDSPPNLLEKYGLDLKKEWYFIGNLKREYFGDDSVRRVATTVDVDKGGHWKIVEVCREVFQPNSHGDITGQTLVGHKRIYQFYQPLFGRPGSVTSKTEWIMVLYTTLPEPEIAPAGYTNERGDRVVMCKIVNYASVRRQMVIKGRYKNKQTLEELQMFFTEATKEDDDDQTAQVSPKT